jgi:hypothetical protein
MFLDILDESDGEVELRAPFGVGAEMSSIAFRTSSLIAASLRALSTYELATDPDSCSSEC